MIYLHRIYQEVFAGDAGHGHRPTDTVRVPDPDALDLDGVNEVPALVPGRGGIWRVSCTPACEAEILAKVQYSGVSPEAIPLTEDEKKMADAESKRGNVEVANLARAVHQMAEASARAEFGGSLPAAH